MGIDLTQSYFASYAEAGCLQQPETLAVSHLGRYDKLAERRRWEERSGRRNYTSATGDNSSNC